MEDAYRALRQKILQNELPPGTVMLEHEVAEMLGMSRTPVREALIRLSNDGMVEVRPRRGMRVLPISLDDMREIYEVVTALEAIAAERLANDGVSEDGLAQLDGAVADMDRALEAGDLTAWAEGDTRFHALLASLAGNRRLIRVIDTYWAQAQRVRLTTLQLRPKPVGSNDDHRAVVAAIRARDGATAHRLHKEHRKRAADLLIGLLRDRGLDNL